MKKNQIVELLVRTILCASGVLCIIHAPNITEWFPYVIGVIMTLVGLILIMSTMLIFHGKPEEKAKYSSRLTRGILLLIIGIITFFKQADAMPFIGVTWGLLGLLKGGRCLTRFISGPMKSNEGLLDFCRAVIEITLGCLLLFDPVDAAGKHIYLLGIQIIVYAVIHMEDHWHPILKIKSIHKQADEMAKVRHEHHE